jgi:hypothetical protein
MTDHLADRLNELRRALVASNGDFDRVHDVAQAALAELLRDLPEELLSSEIHTTRPFENVMGHLKPKLLAARSTDAGLVLLTL